MPQETIGMFDEPSSSPVADQERFGVNGTGIPQQGLQSTDWLHSQNNGFDDGMKGFAREPTESYPQTEEGPPVSEVMGVPKMHRKEVARGLYDYSAERNQPVQLSATETNGIPTFQNRSRIKTARSNERVALSNLPPSAAERETSSQCPRVNHNQQGSTSDQLSSLERRHQSRFDAFETSFYYVYSCCATV
jgi:hypothetical protein